MVSQYVPHAEDWAHQSFAVTEIVRLVNEGETAICVTSPTGAGKSRVVQRGCEHFVANGETVGVMSNRILLTTQLLRGLDKAGVHAGCRAAGFEAYTDLNAPVQVISGPTEIARVLNRREKNGDDVQLPRLHKLFVDEAHLQCGEKTVEIFNELKAKYGTAIIGITATPLGISSVYGHLVIAGNNSSLRECGALVRAKCFEPAVMDLSKVRKSKTGVFSQTELEDEAKAIFSQHLVGHVLSHWKKHNPDSRPSLGMAPGVKESLWLAQEYWKHGINAAHIDAGGIYVNGAYKSTTDQADRDELFAMAKDGRVPQIWNRYVLREALDLPWLYLLSIATPIASLTSYLQVVGRILRACEGKDEALVLDHCGVIRMHGSPNLDRDKDWEQYFHEPDADKITKDAQQKKTDPQSKEKEPITCPQCQNMRNGGSKCPNCGHEHPKSVRMVIQESGELKPVTGDVYEKRKVSERPETEKQWTQIYYRMRNAKKPMTFKQAIAFFYREHGYWPPSNLPFMPKNPTDLSRHIKSVEYEDLHHRSH